MRHSVGLGEESAAPFQACLALLPCQKHRHQEKGQAAGQVSACMSSVPSLCTSDSALPVTDRMCGQHMACWLGPAGHIRHVRCHQWRVLHVEFLVVMDTKKFSLFGHLT